MSAIDSLLQSIRAALAAGEIAPESVAAQSLACANRNAGQNVYLWQDKDAALRESLCLPSRFPNEPRPLLYGLPIAVKDCFDLAGAPTTVGTRFYTAHNGIARHDSAVVVRLRQQGAVITGKTHLHPLAYGITGENPEYGDCVQPLHPENLTGGSSSGSAAAVQEGSAVAAIGTDTGGSIRVPAALCGLAGFRASLGLAHEKGLWRGCMPLAQSFDTLGWLTRDLRDLPLLGEALFDLRVLANSSSGVRIGAISSDFLRDCEPSVIAAFSREQQRLCDHGAEIVSFDATFWNEALEIFAPIQAHEAAAIHKGPTGGDFSHFERSIAERLAWGASISAPELDSLRQRHMAFRDRMEALLRDFDYLIAPCSPMARLAAGGDHSKTRSTILRYTTPASLAGLPAVTLPGAGGTGVQLIAARGADARLLAFAAALAEP